MPWLLLWMKRQDVKRWPEYHTQTGIAKLGRDGIDVSLGHDYPHRSAVRQLAGSDGSGDPAPMI